ncbi:Histidine triad (HIT) protein [Parasponia andersonii]|uniref:E3 ubiquitin-protein ligase CHIP n=1 Tax=Parasponia andersonii TaxID=3476 RepID=A0A2P5DP71_PARAD|nr:Histidine triad (HIT) protein [Parasponia andersonii]
MEARRLAVIFSHICPPGSGFAPARLATVSVSGCASGVGNPKGECVFCKIIRGESPAFKLYEDDACLCILDTNPLSRGAFSYHPKVSFFFIGDNSSIVIAAMCSKVPFISSAIMKATGSDSFNLLVNNGAAAGQVIFHTHIHIIPRKASDCLWASESLRRQSLKLDREASRLAECVREQLSSENCKDSEGEGSSLVRNYDWARVEEDCRRAIQLDNSSVKGHYMLGLALLERKEYAEGIKELEKALDLGRVANPKGYMVEEIWQELAKAKYMEWENASTKRSWDLQSLKEACETALKQKHLLDDSEVDGFNDEGSTEIEQLKVLERVFQIAGDADTPQEVPDYLCCKITLDIFRDPVITPSGLTYERSVIMEHLCKVGTFDPITREPLDERQLVPNLAIKEAVQAFLDKHGWAYRTD